MNLKYLRHPFQTATAAKALFEHAEVCSSWWPLHTGQVPKKLILKKREIDKYILAS
jgi:hypothetical protein